MDQLRGPLLGGCWQPASGGKPNQARPIAEPAAVLVLILAWVMMLVTHLAMLVRLRYATRGGHANFLSRQEHKNVSAASVPAVSPVHMRQRVNAGG